MTEVTEGEPPVTIITVETVPLVHRRSHQQPAPLTRCQWELQMTKSFTAKIRDTSLALGFAAIVSIISTSSSFAFSEEVKQACYSDAFRLCSSEIPNIQKTTACMMQRKSQLSAGCRAAVDKEFAKGASGKVADARDSQ